MSSIYVSPWVQSAARDVLVELNKAAQKVPGPVRAEFFKHFPRISGEIEAAIARNAPAVTESKPAPIAPIPAPVPVKEEPTEIKMDMKAVLVRELSGGKNLRLNQLSARLGYGEAEILAVLESDTAIFDLGPKGWWRLK